MATKTIAEKLGIKPNSTIWLSNATHLHLIEPLPENVWVADEMAKSSAALLFANDASVIRSLLSEHQANLAKPKALWVAYPKANRTDINRDTLWPILSEYGMRPISQVAIDEVWSALRFRELKEGEVFDAGG